MDCTEACQAYLAFTVSWSLLKLMSIDLVMPSNDLILCHPLLLPSVFPSFEIFSKKKKKIKKKIFSSELALHHR